MPDLTLDPNKVSDILQQHGLVGLNATMNSARQAISSGGKVTVQYEYENAPPGVEQVITSLDQFEKWRKEITPIYLKRFECPLCHKTLRHMGENTNQVPRRFKCYDPPGCKSIFRLSTDHPPRLMRFDEHGGPETPHSANEL